LIAFAKTMVGALAITLVPQGVWWALIVMNLRTTPSVPYSAFNKRDIDGALALMTQDVELAQGFGGRQGCRKRRDPRLLDSTMG
jgi:hypothetical protein